MNRALENDFPENRPVELAPPHSISMLLFSIAGQRFALPLTSVNFVVPAAEVEPLPNAPEIILGVVNVRGRVIPVLEMRRKFGLPSRELELTDHFLVAQTRTLAVALVVGEVSGLEEINGEELVPAEKILPGLDHVKGILKCQDDLVIITDLDQFLSLQEEASLRAALDQHLQ